jgi:hypothetical protein
LTAWVLALLLAAPLDGGAASEADADAPTVGVSLDRTEAFVGDRLTLTVSAVAKAGVAVRLPSKLELGKLEVLDRADGDPQGRDLGDGRRSYRFSLGVAAYEIGELELPPIALSYAAPGGTPRTVETAPVTLRIRGLVAEDEPKPEVQPLRPPRSALVEDRRLVHAARWTAAGLAGGAALFVGLLLLRRALRRARVAQAAPPPRRPPEEVALERLAELRAAANFAVDGYRPFYFAVAEVVRAYLGARYGFDSLELTTTELVDQLARRAPAEAAPDGRVARFLAESDLVKFAKAGSTDEAARAALDAAEEIVRRTTATAAAAAAAAGTEAGAEAGALERASG